MLADPLTALSLSLGLVFGTAGLPHILMRFFTVGDAREARKSVLYATGFIGYFFNVIFLLGLASIVIVSQQPRFFEGGEAGGKLLGGGNMVVMHLAQAVGGNLLLGFLSAVTFATILAVVSGLALAGASAIAHDLYARVIMKGAASEAQELRVTKLATLGLGLVAIALGIVFENINVAFMVALAFGIAASANFPVLFLSMFWSGLTTRGALAGGYVGLFSAMGFVVFSRLVWMCCTSPSRCSPIPSLRCSPCRWRSWWRMAFPPGPDHAGHGGKGSLRRPVRTRPDRPWRQRSHRPLRRTRSLSNGWQALRLSVARGLASAPEDVSDTDGGVVLHALSRPAVDDGRLRKQCTQEDDQYKDSR